MNEKYLNISDIKKGNEVDKSKKALYDEYVEKVLLEDDYEKCKDIFCEYNIVSKNKKRCLSEFYRVLLRKESTYEKGKLILQEMKRLDLKINVKLYNILLKKVNDKDKIIKLYNDIKFYCIPVDLEFLKELSKKLFGTKEYYEIQYEKYCISKIMELSDEINKFNNIEDLFDKLREYDIEESTYFYSLLINRIENIDNIVILINYLGQNKKSDEKIYISVLSKLIKSHFNNNYFFLLDKIYLSLNLIQKENLIKILKETQNFDYKTHYIMECEKKIKYYKKLLYSEKNIKKQQYIMGRLYYFYWVDKYDLVKIEKDIIEEINEISNMENEEREYYELELENLKGKLKSIYEGKELRKSLKEKKIPILYLNYIDTNCKTINIDREFYSKYALKINNIEDLKVNSFINLVSKEEFKSSILKINYEKFDVRVSIYTTNVNKYFKEDQTEESKLRLWMEKMLIDKVYILNYKNIEA